MGLNGDDSVRCSHTRSHRLIDFGSQDTGGPSRDLHKEFAAAIASGSEFLWNPVPIDSLLVTGQTPVKLEMLVRPQPDLSAIQAM